MKIDDFVQEMKERAARVLLEVSTGGERSEKHYRFQAGSAHIITIRGGAIEKAAITHLILTAVKPPGADRASDGVVYQMEVFPDNPFCPMGHFNLQWTTGESNSYSMNLDLFPAVRVEEDLAAVKTVMDGIADRFGRGREMDFTRWGCAITMALGCEPSDFIRAYEANVRAQNEEVLGSNAISHALCSFMKNRDTWQGTASDLLQELESLAEDLHINIKDNSWPKAGNSLTRKLNVLKPNLRRIGIAVDHHNCADKRLLKLVKLDGRDDGHDGCDDSKNGTVIKKCNKINIDDGSDGNDGIFI